MPFVVRGFECIGDLACDPQRLIQGQRALLDSLLQRLSLHQFHDQVIRSNVVEVADVGMIQRGDS